MALSKIPRGSALQLPFICLILCAWQVGVDEFSMDTAVSTFFRIWNVSLTSWPCRHQREAVQVLYVSHVIRKTVS